MDIKKNEAQPPLEAPQKARLKALLLSKAKTMSFREKIITEAKENPDAVAIEAEQSWTYASLLDYISQPSGSAGGGQDLDGFVHQLHNWWQGGHWVVADPAWNWDFSEFMRRPLDMQLFEQEQSLPAKVWGSFNGRWWGLDDSLLAGQLDSIGRSFDFKANACVAMDFTRMPADKVMIALAALSVGARLVDKPVMHKFGHIEHYFCLPETPELAARLEELATQGAAKSYCQDVGPSSSFSSCYLYHPAVGVWLKDNQLQQGLQPKLVDEQGSRLAEDAIGRITFAKTSAKLPVVDVCATAGEVGSELVDTGLKGQCGVQGEVRLEIDRCHSLALDNRYFSSAEIVSFLYRKMPEAGFEYRFRAGTKGIMGILYLAGSEQFDTGLKNRVRECLPPCYAPDHIVELCTFPRLANGALDIAALQALPLISEQQLERWHQRGGGELKLTPKKRQSPGCELPGIAQILSASTEASAPALLNGAALEVSKGHIRLLRDALLDAAENSDNGVLLLGEQEQRVTYPALLQAGREILTALKDMGLKSGDTLIFLVQDNYRFLSLFWACQLGGIIPVFCEWPKWQERQQGALAKLRHIADTLKTSPIIADEHVYEYLPQRQDFANLVSFQTLYGCAPCEELPEIDPRQAALMLLTSGSTGKPKMVPQSHEAVLTRSRATIAHNHFNDGDISFNWMPMDHVGGIVMFHVRDTFLAIEQIHAATDLVLQQPLSWLDALARYRVTMTWAPNFAYQLVVDRLKEMKDDYYWDLSQLHFILNAGEAIQPRTAVQFMQMLARCDLAPTAMKPTWGMSETCSGVVYNRCFDATSADAPYVHVGFPVPGFSLRIVDDNANVRRQGEIGELEVKGRNVLKGYHLNEQENRQVFTQDGWFKTGDLACIDEHGLAITGRSKELIIINGVNYSCQEIEAAVDEPELVDSRYTTACPIRLSNGREGAALFVVPVASPLSRREVAQKVRQQVFEHTQLALDQLVFLSPGQIPKSNIGKILRSQLQQTYAGGQFSDVTESFAAEDKDAPATPDWFARCALKPAPLLSSYRASEPCLHIGRPFCARPPQERVLESGEDFSGQLQAELEAQNGQTVNLAIWLWDEQLWPLMETLGLLHRLAQDKKLNLRIFSRSALTGLQGLVRSVVKEAPLWRLGWICADTRDQASWSGYFSDEMSAPNLLPEVVYQQGKRYRSALVAGAPQADEAGKVPFGKGETYIIYGGLSAVARPLIRLLRDKFDARIVLLGRRDTNSALSAWPEAEQDVNIQYIQCPGALTAAGMADIEGQIPPQWLTRLHGVIHAAGVFEPGTLDTLTPDGWCHSCEGKVAGAAVLADWLQQHLPGEGLFIQLSSVNGYFGGMGVTAYAAANSYQQALSRHLNAGKQLKSYCLLFSPWQETGMSLQLDSVAATRANGFHVMVPDQALRSMLLCLSDQPGEWCIGVELAHANLLNEYSEQANLMYEVAQTRPEGVTELKDDTGVTCRFARQNRQQAPQDMTQTQEQLYKLWQESLGHSEFSIDDSYFAVGGNSMRLVRLRELIMTQTGREVSLTDFFKFPTIRQLSQLFGEVQEQHQERKESTQNRAANRKAQLARRKSKKRL
ncbi:AMP-binding protein [Microbulbifer sp. ANSA003]|uniref:AMP-binding protein n=1 Tax=Microbulbifer sp. ANSA003 TaxID=3243360 RepID=UPI00404208D1